VTAAALLWVDSIGGPQAIRQRYGLAAPAVSLAAHALVAVTPAGELLPWGVVNGTLYGFALGSLLTWIASTASSLVQYALARSLARELDLERLRAGLPAWLRRFPVDHPAFLIAARWLPVGGPIANVAAGASGVMPLRIACCALVGGAPPALVMAALGAGLLQLA
jgi:uncharacterized membrane protein YdjX (TVP38/TMEM64 family)